MNKFLTSMSRRTFLKGTAAGVGILAAPAIISNKALASSGELNFMGWAGYPDLAAKVFPAFEKATGIKVNFNEQPDQDAMFAQAKLSLQTGAHRRLSSRRSTASAAGPTNGLVQGWDLNKLSMDNYLPGLADGKMGEMATVDGKRMIVLSVWGTEAIVYSKTDAPTEYGKASLGDLFDPKYRGQGLPARPLGARRDGPLARRRGQAAEAVARQLQGRGHDEGALGHRARRGRQGQGATSPSSG